MCTKPEQDNKADGHETSENCLKTTNWKDLAELIGITAIVASLIFVGLQMKQSQDIAIGTQYQERASMMMGVMTAQMQSDLGLALEGEQILAIVAHGDIPPEIKSYMAERTPEEAAFIGSKPMALMVSFDNSYFQYESGFLVEETWVGAREAYGGERKADN